MLAPPRAEDALDCEHGRPMIASTYAYYAAPMSAPAITAFRHHAVERWLQALRRRGRRHWLLQTVGQLVSSRRCACAGADVSCVVRNNPSLQAAASHTR